MLGSRRNDKRRVMIKDIMAQNEKVQPNDRIMSKLHADFPQCFNKEGQFDMEKFQQLVQTEVDVTHEGYELNFLGKNYANLIASTETETVIQPDLEHNAKPENCNSQNVYISGDNLDALKHLLKSYSNSIKCIYIDPPYNTGSDGFVYNDKFTFTEEQIQTKLGVSEEKAKRILDLARRGSASHSAWLMFMAPRLMLAKDLLTEDGVIFISIDDNEQADLKLLCDSVFGEENMIASFIIIRSEGGGLAKNAVIGHDYLLAYCKSKETYTRLGKPKDIRGQIVKKEDGEEYWIETDWLREEFGKYGTCHYEDILKFYPAKKKKEIDEGISKGEYVLIEKDNKHIVGRYRKVADDTSKFYTILKHLNKNGVSDLEELLMDSYFSYPKPVSLIREFVFGVSNKTKKESDIILDFFSGSATTAHAVMKLNSEDGGNRKFIMVQIPELTPKDSEARKAGYETIDQIGQERIRRAASKIKTEHPDYQGDLGFKHYTLQDVPQNTLDKMETFDPTSMFGEGDILQSFGKDTVLETWCVKDGYGFGANVSELKLAGYTAYHCGSHLYFVEGNSFDENAMISLIDKYHSDPAFNPQNIVLFGYSFSFTQVEMLRKNLATLSDSAKNLNMNLDIRY